MANGQEEIESLFVAIRGDVGPLLDDAKKGVNQAAGELGKFEQAGKRSFDETGKSAKRFGAELGIITGAVMALTNALINMASRGVSALVNLGKSAIAGNTQFEVFRTQFETLLGSAEAAQARMQELARFGAETPFDLPEVVQASRLLQTLGGTALATGDNLRMVGDIAAGVNRPFADVAMWIGRMYDALQNGRPFGEAAMRLTEMGALSGKARAELERLQKSGASGAEMWAKFNELVGSRFAGNMGRLAATFQGIMSNLRDFSGMLLRIGGEAPFEAIKDSAQRLLDILGENRPELEAVARAFGELAKTAIELFSNRAIGALENLDLSSLEEMAINAAEFVDKFSLLSDIISEINFSPGFVESTAEVGALLDRALETAMQLAALTAAESAKRTAEADTRRAFAEGQGADLSFGRGALYAGILGGVGQEDVNQAAATAGNEAFNKSIEESLSKFEEMRQKQDERRQALEDAKNATDADTESVQDNTDAVEDNAAAQEELQKQLAKFGADLIDLREETAQRILELEASYNEKLLQLENDYLEKRFEAGKKLADSLANLEEDTGRKRGEIFARAREDLAKLEANTDKEIAEHQDDFNEDERRRTEDHLRRMRDIRASYLSGLEEAVAARDARQIVALRKRYQEEQAKETENFATQQGRRQEDQNKELARIRENERARADEIIQAREQDLLNLRENETRKQQELEESYQEQLDKLNQNLVAAKAKEGASFIERKTELENAMANRLETIAKGLANNLDMEEETANAVLQRLADTYGPEGSALVILEAFAERRAALLALTSAEEEAIAAIETLSTASSGPGGRTRRSSGIRSFAGGGSMIATSPTLVQFGEAGPELAQFTPLNSTNTSRTEGAFDVNVNFSGVPAGIDQRQMEEVAAAVLVRAFRESGMH